MTAPRRLPPSDPITLAAERLRQTEAAYRDRQATDGELDEAKRALADARAGKPHLTSFACYQWRTKGRTRERVFVGLVYQAMPPAFEPGPDDGPRAA